MTEQAKKSLLIVQVDVPQNEQGGDFYYRTYAPGLAMAQEKGVYTVNLTNFHPGKEQIMLDADILVLNSICDPDVLPLVYDRKQHGKPTVYELNDDFSAIPPWNPVHSFYQNPENTRLLETLAGYCDALQFSSEELKCKYGRLNPLAAVFPNHILTLPEERRHARNSKTIIGWGGSFGHLEDMRSVSDAVISWIMSREDVALHLMCADKIWELFDALPSDRKKRFPTGSLLDYYEFLKSIDIGIAPLQQSGFNSCRSDVKFIEYAAHGVVPIMQAAQAYSSVVRHGCNGFLFEDHDNLLRILENVSNDISLRVRISMAAREYVVRERLFKYRIHERIAFYRNMLPSSGKKESKLEERFEKTASQWTSVKNGRHLMLLPTRFELLLRVGLTRSQDSESAESCRALFHEASKLEPNNYLPDLLGAYCAGDTWGSLQTAVKKNPRSIKAWMLSGEEFSKHGDLQSAIDCFSNAAKIFGAYDFPQTKVFKVQRLIEGRP